MTAHTHPHTHHDHHDAPVRTTTLHVGGLHYASEKAVVERVLGRRPGVVDVEANPVSQTATVTFDPGATSVATRRSGGAPVKARPHSAAFSCKRPNSSYAAALIASGDGSRRPVD